MKGESIPVWDQEGKVWAGEKALVQALGQQNEWALGSPEMGLEL